MNRRLCFADRPVSAKRQNPDNAAPAGRRVLGLRNPTAVCCNYGATAAVPCAGPGPGTTTLQRAGGRASCRIRPRYSYAASETEMPRSFLLVQYQEGASSAVCLMEEQYFFPLILSCPT